MSTDAQRYSVQVEHEAIELADTVLEFVGRIRAENGAEPSAEDIDRVIKFRHHAKGVLCQVYEDAIESLASHNPDEHNINTICDAVWAIIEDIRAGAEGSNADLARVLDIRDMLEDALGVNGLRTFVHPPSALPDAAASAPASDKRP